MTVVGIHFIMCCLKWYNLPVCLNTAGQSVMSGFQSKLSHFVSILCHIYSNIYIKNRFISDLISNISVIVID